MITMQSTNIHHQKLTLAALDAVIEWCREEARKGFHRVPAVALRDLNEYLLRPVRELVARLAALGSSQVEPTPDELKALGAVPVVVRRPVPEVPQVRTLRPPPRRVLHGVRGEAAGQEAAASYSRPRGSLMRNANAHPANAPPPGWVRIAGVPLFLPAWRHEATGWEVRRVGTPKSTRCYSLHLPGSIGPLAKRYFWLDDAIAAAEKAMATASRVTPEVTA